MPQIQFVSGESFAADEGETILDAALRAGVGLAYSCRTGRCSTCATQVHSGETKALLSESGLVDAGLSAGTVLACARTAISPLMLEAPLLDARLPPSRITPAKIDSLQRLADDVMRVRLRLPPAQPLRFLAGQYVTVAAGADLKRSYSIASLPQADGVTHFDLHIRAVPGGQMSAYWFERAKPGDLLRVHGPQGTFFAREPVTATWLLLATGTGIAPLQSMLLHLATQPPEARPRRIVLMWGNRQRSDFYVDPTAWGLPLDYRPALSGAEPDWAHARGRITALLDGLPAAELPETTVYACGSPAMIHDAKQALLARGLPARRFHSDAFVPSL